MESTSDMPPEEDLWRLRNEGMISEAEYQDLLGTMKQSGAGDPGAVGAGSPSIPVSLKIVAVLFILSGVASVIEIVVDLTYNNKININFGVLCLFVGPGLLRFRRGWRTCGLVFLWIGLIVAPIVFMLGLFGNMPAYFVLFGAKLSQIPGWWGCVVAVPFFLLVLWQYRVLTRPDIRRLFGLPSS